MCANVMPGGKLDHEAAAVELRRYLDAVLRSTRFDLRYRIERHEPAAAATDLETPEVIVDFDGPDHELLLERGAELLKALEYIAVRWLRLDPQLHDRVRFDCGNYRATRIAELKLSAEVAAERVRETRTPFRFNPMTARERRIIHLVLKDQPGLRTTSEGLGEERRVVLFPAESS
jgi:spoIIIJ-associated protein